MSVTLRTFLIYFVVIFIAYAFYSYTEDGNTNSDSTVLVIGILSARNNFLLRETARSTWLEKYSPVTNSSIHAWFIIGKDECMIPPEYRLDKYGCEKWNISQSGVLNKFHTLYAVRKKECSSRNIFNQGFSFKVNHAVVVRQLGILHDLLSPNASVRVAILDIQTKEIVVEAIISRNTSKYDKHDGYFYKYVEAILLPKDYEGMVLVEGYLLQEACANIKWNDGGGVITFNRIYLTPSHLDSVKFSNDVYSAVSILFYVDEFESLKTVTSAEDKRKESWLKESMDTDQKLNKEISEKKDILLVDVLDVYRNLPIKLLKFYKWVNQNYKFSYLMKTDDDTIVDVDSLMRHLENNSEFSPDQQWIWSWFRKEWPVNYIGKWSDYDYKSPIYPSFPCGATYFMSRTLTKWLGMNADYLFPYQGEDVSMGIWLSAIQPKLIDDDNFICDSKCNDKNYNRAQLSADQISKAWEVFKTCKNLCSCS